MKIHIIRTLLILLLLGTFFIIFGFSNQNGEESGSLSTNLTKLILKQINHDEAQNDEQVIKKVEVVVRKLAHFSIYTLVGFLLMSLFSTYELQERKRILFTLIIGILYAISDEIHQAFVPERGPQITDVMIDSLGVTFGIIIVLTLLKTYYKIKKKVR